jgi:hypothetical protein
MSIYNQDQCCNEVEDITILGQLSLADGKASEPSLNFTNDTDTGLYRGAANQINFSTGGTSRMSINNTETTISELKVTNDMNATNVVADNNVSTATLGATTINTSSINTSDGSQFAPSYNFSLGSTTGIYRSSSLLGVTSAGQRVAEFGATTTLYPTDIYTASRINIRPGASHRLRFVNGTDTDRFLIGLDGTESGGNVGSDLTINKVLDNNTTSECLRIRRSDGLVTGNLNFDYGQYTPTFTNNSNCTTFTNYKHLYHRIGWVCTVWGALEITFTAVDFSASFYVSLPFLPGSGSFNNYADLNGSGMARQTGGGARVHNQSMLDITAFTGVGAKAYIDIYQLNSSCSTVYLSYNFSYIIFD